MLSPSRLYNLNRSHLLPPQVGDVHHGLVSVRVQPNTLKPISVFMPQNERFKHQRSARTHEEKHGVRVEHKYRNIITDIISFSAHQLAKAC